MVLAFFTGARPINTFSSRDYDRRPLPLSHPSSSPPPPPSPLSSQQQPLSTSLPPPRTATGADDDVQVPPPATSAAHHPLYTVRPLLLRSDAVVVVGTSYHRTTRIRSAPPQTSLISDHRHQQQSSHYQQNNKHQQQQASRPAEERLDQQLARVTRSGGTEDHVREPLEAASQLKLKGSDPSAVDQGFLGGALARINPWLSACDLAQPSTAPDLQVQRTREILKVLPCYLFIRFLLYSCPAVNYELYVALKYLNSTPLPQN